MKERVASSFAEIERAESRSIRRGMGLLAIVGSTAPFVGLFGTVWGIMNSFIGISKAQTTNLAVVAPGIAEALLATAIGLVAAIPAVIIYNHLARQTGAYLELVANLSGELLRVVSRDLDRGVAAGACRSARGGVSAMAGNIGVRSAATLEETHEINVTPFIDVMLVLLIIFMVAAPLSTVDLPVDLPAAERRAAEEARQADLSHHQGRSRAGARRDAGQARRSRRLARRARRRRQGQAHLPARRHAPCPMAR